MAVTGLDKILERITDEAAERADAVIAKAQKDADKVIETATTEASEILIEAEEKALKLCSDISERAKSSTELFVRQEVLKKKQEIIEEVINSAYKKLLSLNEENYFNILLKLLANCPEKHGELILCKRDKNRITTEFTQKLKSGFPNVKISEDEADIAGGFILRIGAIEENCSFSALFSNEHDKIVDKIYPILFG